MAGALLCDGRVLAAHRSRPPVGWEFPGGKLEPGETPVVGLARELREELGLDAAVGAELGRAEDERVVLTLFRCDPVAGGPVAGPDHDELRLLDAGELDALDWLRLDRELLPAVRPLLAG